MTWPSIRYLWSVSTWHLSTCQGQNVVITEGLVRRRNWFPYRRGIPLSVSSRIAVTVMTVMTVMRSESWKWLPSSHRSSPRKKKNLFFLLLRKRQRPKSETPKINYEILSSIILTLHAKSHSPLSLRLVIRLSIETGNWDSTIF